MEKKKYSVKIADVDMNIISDEREEIVTRLVSQLDKQITDITKQSRNFSKIDATILVALDHASNRLKAEKRVRNLEAQIALYDANLRRMREENIKLKNAMLGKVPEVSEEIIAEEQLTIEEAAPAPAEKKEESGAHDIEELFEETEAKPEEAKEEVAAEAEPVIEEKAERHNKLRQIESLLRGN